MGKFGDWKQHGRIPRNQERIIPENPNKQMIIQQQ